MANIKFSQFTEQTDPANVAFVVGYNGSTNVKIDPANIGGGLFEQGVYANSTQRIGSGTSEGNGSTVGGGAYNVAGYGAWATVSGGRNNTAQGYGATIGGGIGNSAVSYYDTVSGGSYNNAYGMNSTVSGGTSNSATGYRSTTGGGSSNTASGIQAFVGGGGANTVSGGYSSVVGGVYNINAGTDSTIIGGRNNVVESMARRATISGYGNRIIAANPSSHILGDNITSDRANTTFVENLSIKAIPTAATGLPAGSVWSNGNVLNIV